MHGDNTIGTFCGHIGEDGSWSSTLWICFIIAHWNLFRLGLEVGSAKLGIKAHNRRQIANSNFFIFCNMLVTLAKLSISSIASKYLRSNDFVLGERL